MPKRKKTSANAAHQKAAKQARVKQKPAKAKTKKITRYKKPLNINIGMMIFLIIFVYLLLSVYNYTTRTRVMFYEVTEGNIVDDQKITGLILREESVKTAPQSGYVNFYIREGKRASLGARVYSLDETGELGRFLKENQSASTTLTDDGLNTLKKQLTSFSLSYRDNSFRNTYNERFSLQSSVAEYMNYNLLDSLEDKLTAQGIRYQQITSESTGVVSYAIDGLENLPYDEVTEDYYVQTSYPRKTLGAGQLVEVGSPIFKLITSENWSIVFPVSESLKESLEDRKSLTIYPTSSDLSLSGAFSMFNSSDGKTYGKVDLNKYMIQFSSMRYLDFSLDGDESEGLKIPVSSITKKEFYTIPKDYLTKGGDNGADETGVFKQVFNNAGEDSIVFTPCDVYQETDDLYYIDKGDGSPFSDGDYIIKPNTNERVQIGATASLTGVYNINRGYTSFRQIEEMGGNGEYMIVKKNTKYGLSVYDHIVLDASAVGESTIVYQ